MSQAENRSPRRWSRRLAWLLASCMVFVLLYTTRGLTLPQMGDWLDVEAVSRRTDYVLVLNGEPNTRPFTAAELVNTGLASHVLIAPIKVSNPDTRWPPYHELVQTILLKCGISQNQITLLDGESTNTFEEAETLARFLDGHPGATVSVVTSNFHTRRTRWAFQRVLGARGEQVHLVSAATDGFDASNWWKHENGFVWYVSEYFKLGFYSLRYGNGVWWCAALMVAAGAVMMIRRSRELKGMNTFA